MYVWVRRPSGLEPYTIIERSRFLLCVYVYIKRFGVHTYTYKKSIVKQFDGNARAIVPLCRTLFTFRYVRATLLSSRYLITPARAFPPAVVDHVFFLFAFLSVFFTFFNRRAATILSREFLSSFYHLPLYPEINRVSEYTD